MIIKIDVKHVLYRYENSAAKQFKHVSATSYQFEMKTNVVIKLYSCNKSRNIIEYR